MVRLRIWNSAKQGGGGWGHSSLEIGGAPPAGIYISWWPGDLDGKLPSFAENNSFQKDLQLEGQPSFTFDLIGLDERAMKFWWMRWRRSSMNLFYMWAGKNCSSTVAKALQAGGSDDVAHVAGWRAPGIWFPSTLASYARAIQAGFAAKNRLTS